MGLSKEEIEYLHDKGKMPDWAYYSQNGNSLEMNYRDILEKRQYQYQNENQIEKYVLENIEIILEKLLDNITL